ncbi:MAG: DUF2256 domain-containing protein [Panacagrimonas sp.]
MPAKTPPSADKICLCCQRGFSWRKKWARDWDQLKYCSEACRRGHGRPGFKPR